MRRRERSNKIYVNMIESLEGNRDLLRVEVGVAENFALLAGKTGSTPVSYIIGESMPNKPGRDKTVRSTYPRM